MAKKSIRIALAAIFLLLGLNSVALAQPGGQQVAGIVDGVRDNTIWLTNGRSIPLPETPNVTRLMSAAPEDFAPGRFVAISAYRASDGSLVASEVRLFAVGATVNESQREMTETRFCEPGCRPGDLMTNASIDEAEVNALEGGELMVSVSGQMERVKITDTTQLHQTSPGSIADVTPGIFVLGFINNGVATNVWVDWTRM